MKTKILEVRPLGNLTDKYYTSPNWTNKIVDGVEFIPVVKKNPSICSESQVTYFMRKDNMEYING